jgi:hypothetical protein
MTTTIFLSRVLGPVLVVRGVSILLDRRHFASMLDGVDREANSLAFSLFPIALLMGFLALANVHRDTSSVAALLIHGIAWGGILKSTALILFPRAVLAKAQLLGRSGFLHVVTAVCLVVGAYFTWFGYVAAS